ncbi:MAG: DUF4191 domain-containing protein [Bowdeniella nasicola]|nr:DUF4191 domain-containing protein [Bowdeniella nasicola]
MSNAETTPKKRRWYHNIADAYRLTQEAYPWMRWALLAILVLVFGGSIVLGISTGRWIWYPLLGLMLALLAMMVLLSLYTRRASYAQIDGQPGATVAVLQQTRGWNTEQEPVGINPRTQDMVFRTVGRPGVVLLVEGPINRTKRLVRDEERKVRRSVTNVPVHTIYVGNGEGQVPLRGLERAMRKLPKKLTRQQVAVVAKRLSSLGAMRLPIPKGIDPMRARPDRKGLRGR